MQKYGRYWLRFTGYDPSLTEVLTALLATIGFVAFWVGVRFWLLSIHRKPSLLKFAIAIALAAGAVVFWIARPERLNDDLSKLFFPRQMVFMVGLAVPLVCVSVLAFSLVGGEFGYLNYDKLWSIASVSNPISHESFRLCDLLQWASVARVLLFVTGNRGPQWGYAEQHRSASSNASPIAVICIWVTVQVYPHYRDMRTERVAFENERGTIYLQERMLPAWAEVVDFMREAKRRGQAVMSVPEDTALYFLPVCHARLDCLPSHLADWHRGA